MPVVGRGDASLLLLRRVLVCRAGSKPGVCTGTAAAAAAAAIHLALLLLLLLLLVALLLCTLHLQLVLLLLLLLLLLHRHGRHATRGRERLHELGRPRRGNDNVAVGSVAKLALGLALLYWRPARLGMTDAAALGSGRGGGSHRRSAVLLAHRVSDLVLVLLLEPSPRHLRGETVHGGVGGAGSGDRADAAADCRGLEREGGSGEKAGGGGGDERGGQEDTAHR